MKKTKMTLMLCALFVSGVASANCPSNLSVDDLKECIMVEGSGTNYQEWKKAYDKLAETPSRKSDESTVSMTVPGVDVTQVAPAAGKPQQIKND